jgi:hypothetical protein
MSKRYLLFPAIWIAILIFWALPALAQITDSADVAVVSTSSYPGHFAKVEVRLKNPVPIAGFQFCITLSNPDLINFHTDSISIENVLMRIDTCTWQPDSLHGPTCFIDSLVPIPVRNCFIDTVGSLISNFDLIECHGDTADTSQPGCKWIRVFGMAPYGHPIDANPNYRTLFKFGVDAFCIPDSVTDRSCSFYMSPQVNSFLSDPQGYVVPFRYHQGDLTVWWSVPGDANNDSLVDIGDVVFLINYLFKTGPEPCVGGAADANGDLQIDVGDVVYMINYLFKSGLPPCER